MARVYNDKTPITAKRDEWMPIVEQFAARHSTADLPKPPPGLAHRHGKRQTAYYTTTRYHRLDGTVRIYLKWCIPGDHTFTIGTYLATGDGMISPHRIIYLKSADRSVCVFVDAQGLPYPGPI